MSYMQVTTSVDKNTETYSMRNMKYVLENMCHKLIMGKINKKISSIHVLFVFLIYLTIGVISFSIFFASINLMGSSQWYSFASLTML